MLIVAVKRGLIRPAYITSWSQRDVCFYPFRKRRSAQHSSYLRSNKNLNKKRTIPPAHSWLPLHGRVRSLPLPFSTPTRQMLFLLAHAADSLRHTISWAASFRLIWIFMNVVRRPHSIIGEIAWHGAPNPFTLLTSVWEPCTSSNCSLYFTVPGCHQRCRCYGEKWEAKTVWGGAGGVKASSHVKEKSIQEKDEWRFQGYKT